MEDFERIMPLLQLVKDSINEMVLEKKGLFSRYHLVKKVAAIIDSMEEKYTTEELLLVGSFCEYAFTTSDERGNTKRTEINESRWE